MADIRMKRAIGKGWRQTEKNFVTLVFSAGVFFGLHVVMSYILELVKADKSVYHLCVLIFSFIRSFLLVGIIRLWLAAVDDNKPTFGQLFSGADAWINIFLTELAYFAVVLVGTFLFFIPGIIWAVQYQFVTYIVADKNVSLIEAFKESSRLTKGRKMDLLIFGTLLSLINFAGLLCIGFGLLVTLIWTAVAYATMYRQLSDGSVEMDSPDGSVVSSV